MSQERLRRLAPGHRAVFALTLTLLFLATFLVPREAGAIPAFARKYQTSCQTCHVSFPGLTPFGEAFRLNGYRFPGGADPSVSKDQPVSLGAEGYKKLWPRAVWPGEIPGLPPVSLVVENELAYDRASRITSFGGLGGEFEILAGGTMGESISFFGAVEIAREDGGVETVIDRVNILFRPLSTPAVQFKIGSIEPGLLLVSNQRRLSDHRYFVLSETVGDNVWSAEPYQQGFEAFGVIKHRLLYNAGLVEGSGSLGDKSKDVYGRAAYKIGGLEFDGVPPSGASTELPSNPTPWSEKSVALSAFAYSGKGELTGPALGDEFRVFGGDVAVNYLDLLLRAGAATRNDDRPFVDDAAPRDVDSDTEFAEVAWVVYAWLIPVGRWDSMKVESDRTDRLSLTVNGLIRANVKSFLAADWLREPEGEFQNEEIVAGVVFGF